MADELSAPLGKKKSRFKLPRLRVDFRRLPVGRLMAGLLLLVIAIIGLRLFMADDPDGGRPTIEVPIRTNVGDNPLAQEIDTALDIGPEFAVLEAPANGPQITIIDDDLDAFAANTQDGLQDFGRSLNDFGAFEELLEQTQHGAVPRISSTGEAPFGAYSSANNLANIDSGKPQVAVIMTGLGLNEAATLDAISRLPGSISLALAPYGRTLQRTARAAQLVGHELFLEIPMEPFDYPESDPGPHTLLTNQQARTNLDRLFWLMARFGGYVGVLNNQGARFSSSAVDFSPIMEELGIRGLGYVDDGSSNRSLSRQLATANRVPYARAFTLLDANPSRVAILEALDALVAEAEANGQALGVISALPVSVSTVVSWAGQLEERNIVLVPASALMAGDR